MVGSGIMKWYTQRCKLQTFICASTRMKKSFVLLSVHMMNWNCTQKPNFCSVPDDQKSLWTRCSLFHHRGQLDSANPVKEVASYYFIERKLAFLKLVCLQLLSWMQKNQCTQPPTQLSKLLQFKLPKNIGVAKKQRKRGKNSQYWLINIIAEVRLNVPASSISLPI